MATEGQASVLNRVFTAEPEMYDVVMLNDDFTTMDFVVEVLVSVFFHSVDEANRIMMAIHRIGKSVVGCYTLDIAMSKARRATELAREAGFPLRIKVEKKQ